MRRRAGRGEVSVALSAGAMVVESDDPIAKCRRVGPKSLEVVIGAEVFLVTSVHALGQASRLARNVFVSQVAASHA